MLTMDEDEATMTAPIETAPAPRRASALEMRFRLLGWALVITLTAELGLIPFVLFIVSVSVIPAAGVGLILIVPATLLVRWYADRHRQWAGLILADPIDSPYRPIPAGTSLLRRIAIILRDPATWRDWLWLLVHATLGFTAAVLSFSLFAGSLFYLIYPFLYAVTPAGVFDRPFGFYQLNSVAASFTMVPLALVAAVLWFTTAFPLIRFVAVLARNLLAPTAQARLRARVSELATSRAETVDTQAAELRRIERDLHDGAQARLVSLGMNLGLAEELLTRDPEQARKLLAEARESTSSALIELRDLVRGIHPPVLADRGLVGAVQALALANPVPTTVTVDLPGRLPAPVESAAYFAVAETLTNAIKHANAGRIDITVGYADSALQMVVHDDGRGGADLTSGSGLRGVQRRLAAFDGKLSLTSPSGGPTDVRMILPCELSSPKTSPSSGTV